jgi:hypothetical protein
MPSLIWGKKAANSWAFDLSNCDIERKGREKVAGVTDVQKPTVYLCYWQIHSL